MLIRPIVSLPVFSLPVFLLSLAVLCSSLRVCVRVCVCVCVCVCVEVFFPFDGKVNMMLTVLVDHYRSWVMECTCCLVEMVAFLDEPVD